ncbi:efflux RND transporter permease subunit [Halomonas sp.]|uniref:efflux RND transporter permease subunit n=1 Tax=Halomonas sp. TaxID=1486246 RepID=UPI00345BB50F
MAGRLQLQRALRDRSPAAQVAVFKLPQANTVEVVDAVNARLRQHERSGFIPEDIRYQAVGDPAFFIRGAIHSVASAALLGGALPRVLRLGSEFLPVVGDGNIAINVWLPPGTPPGETDAVGREEQSPLMRVQVDRERAADLGLRVSEVGQAIRDAMDGAVPTRFMTANHEYDIRVRLPSEAVKNPDALGGLLLPRDNGVPVQLSEVARFSLGEGPAHIERENQSRVVRVNGDFNTELADVGTIMGEVEARLAGLDLADEISVLLGGQWETLQETRQEMRLVIGLAFLLVLVVLAVQYERLSNPLVILSAAPLSLLGVVGVLWATGTPVSAPVLIGGILLIGVVVNNAILLALSPGWAACRGEPEGSEPGQRAGRWRLRCPVQRSGPARSG